MARDETRGRQRPSRRYPELFDFAPVGVALHDETGRILDANQALCELLGYRRQELLGRTVKDLFHPREWIEGAPSTFPDWNANPRSPQGRQRMLAHSNGKPVFCDLRSTVFVREDGTRSWITAYQGATQWHHQASPWQQTHDELTGLPNREGFNELLGRLLGDVNATRQPAVLFCDIDNFKRINSSLGHEVGDEVLVALAQLLRSELPENCVAARLSGDEFLIICADVDAVGGLEAFTSWVTRSLRTTVPVRGHGLGVSATVGAAAFDPSARTATELLRFADAARTQAKARGPGQMALADPAQITALEEVMHLEGQLREAIRNDELALQYQPIVDRSGFMVMAEALVRWAHPDRGMVSAGTILPVAKQGGQLRELDLWVLRTALQQAEDWPTSHGHPVSITINLSDLLPTDPNYLEEVSGIIDEYNTSWDRVVLEVPETTFVELTPEAEQTMAKLIDRGVRFAIDDFGTAYSSLARLKNLPAQIVKLDRHFVAGAENNPADLAIARAMRDMAHAMGRSCVAEGVETPGQFHVLNELGLDTYQGFLFSHPVSVDQLRPLFDKPLPME